MTTPVYTNKITFMQLGEDQRIPCMRELRVLLGLTLRDASKCLNDGAVYCPEDADDYLVDQVMDALRRFTTDVEREKSPLTQDESGFYHCKRGDWHGDAVPTCVIFDD
jgi:hypothetical protein